MRSMPIGALLLVVGFLWTAAPSRAERDGRHDFDFNLGTWNTHIKYRHQAGVGPVSWVELNGTVTVRRIWNGKGFLEEIEADGPTGHFEGLTIFLYNPQSHQWSQSFANSSNGTLDPPMVGEFRDGRGELVAQDAYHGKTAMVRGVWSQITSNAHHFDEFFSYDGGKSWSPSFKAVLTRKAP